MNRLFLILFASLGILLDSSMFGVDVFNCVFQKARPLLSVSDLNTFSHIDILYLSY